MEFTQLISDLKNGQSSIVTKATNQSFGLRDEKVKGNPTGLKIVSAIGGKVTRTIAEQGLLNGIQGLTRKGCGRFGNENIVFFACNSPERVQAELVKRFNINGRIVSAIVNRYLKAINSTLNLTEIQCFEVLQAVSISELASAQSITLATKADEATANLDRDTYNDKIIAERQAAAAAAAQVLIDALKPKAAAASV